MPKKSEKPQSRHHIILFDEDWEWLEKNYGPGGFKSHVGISRAIRTIVHNRVQGMKALQLGEVDRLRRIQKLEEKGDLSGGEGE